MKQKDILTLVAIAIVSGVISFVLSSMFLTSGSNRSVEAEVVEGITTSFERPPDEYFNNESINPTQIIQISPSESSEPFGEE